MAAMTPGAERLQILQAAVSVVVVLVMDLLPLLAAKSAVAAGVVVPLQNLLPEGLPFGTPGRSGSRLRRRIVPAPKRLFDA